MEISIRLATSKDAERIADLSRKTFQETFAADNTKENMQKFLNEQFTRSKLITEVGEPENIFLLAYHDDDLAGYLKLKDGEPPEALKGQPAIEISRLYVLREKNGYGVGSQLINNALEIAVELDKKIVWLGVWERNQKAINFYKKNGFEQFGDTTFMLGDDAQRDLLMKKELPDELFE